MRILDFYIARTIVATSALCLLTLTGLSSIIKWVDQLRNVGQGNYTLLDAMIYVLYLVPRDIELFFPMAVLLGALIGLGMMASSSELVVMQSAGLSRFQITNSAMKTAIPLMLIIMALGEWVAPVAEQKANELQATKRSGGSLIKSSRGIWAKDGEWFVNIGEVEDVNHLRRIILYSFDSSMRLTQIIHAERAVYATDHWSLIEVRQTTLSQEQIELTQLANYRWETQLTPDKLGVVSVKPESLSIQGLLGYLDYLEQNNQSSARYELALWRKLMQPLTVAVMMLVALSFVFGPLRSVTMGARVLLGVVAGFSFYISSQIFGPLTLVYGLPAFIGAVLPAIIFSSVAIYYIRR